MVKVYGVVKAMDQLCGPGMRIEYLKYVIGWVIVSVGLRRITVQRVHDKQLTCLYIMLSPFQILLIHPFKNILTKQPLVIIRPLIHKSNYKNPFMQNQPGAVVAKVIAVGGR